MSATLRVSELAKKKREAGEDVRALGFGQSPFPVPEPMLRECRAHAEEKAYLPVRGLPALRSAIADWARATKGVEVTAEDVMVGPGSKQLLYLLQAALQCDLMLPRPSWVTYAPQAELLQREVRWVETKAEDGWALLPEELDKACQQAASPGAARLLIYNNPSNPTGTAVSANTIKELAAVARKHGLLVLADEIYDYQQFDGAHEPFAKHYPEGTITLTGISKWAGAGGWRMGAFVFPQGLRWLLDAMCVYASETHSCVSAPIQYGAIPAYMGHTDTADGLYMKHYLNASRAVLGAIGTTFAQVINGAGPQLVVPPTGGFYAWVDAEAGGLSEGLASRGISTSAELAAALLEDTGVAMLPASAYGWPPERLCLHAAFVDFDGGAAIRGVDELPRFHHGPGDTSGDAAFARRFAPHVVDGAEKLRAWLDGLQRPMASGRTKAQEVEGQEDQKDYYDQSSHYDVVFRSDHVRLGYFPHLAPGGEGKEALIFPEAGSALTEYMLSLLEMGPGARLLDMGSGKGRACVEAARATGAACTGIDLSTTNTACALDLKAANKDLKLDFVEGSITDMPAGLKRGEFTHIMSVQAWVHVHAALDEVLREAKAALAPGGRAVIEDFCSNDRGEVSEQALRHFYKRLHFDCVLGPRAWRERAEAAGFRVVKFEDLGQHMRRSYELMGQTAREHGLTSADGTPLAENYENTVDIINKQEVSMFMAVLELPA